MHKHIHHQRDSNVSAPKQPTVHLLHKHIHRQWDSKFNMCNSSAHQTAYSALAAQTHPLSLGRQRVLQLCTPNSLQCTLCTNTLISCQRDSSISTEIWMDRFQKRGVISHQGGFSSEQRRLLQAADFQAIHRPLPLSSPPPPPHPSQPSPHLPMPLSTYSMHTCA